MLRVKCPKCGKEQMYDPKIAKGETITSKSKRCVYCGRTFRVHSDQNKSRIVKIVK